MTDSEKPKPYPIAIVTGPFPLDDMWFTPAGEQMERATRNDMYVGDVLHDLNRFWFARKIDARGDLFDWMPMRCAAEARAFLVSVRGAA